MPDITPTIEMRVDGAAILDDAAAAIEDETGTAITALAMDDVTADVLDGINLTWGIKGTGPTDKVAQPGNITFQLDNSTNNSGGLLGYYSPDNSNARGGFVIGSRVLLKLAYNGTTQTVWKGRITKIKPDAGQYDSRRTSVTAMDYMYTLATHNLKLVPVLITTSVDLVIRKVLNNMPIYPENISIETSPDSLTIALNSEADEKTKGITAIQKAAQTDLGLVYVSQGVLVYINRNHRPAVSSADMSFSSTMVELEADRDIDEVFNVVKGTGYPARIDDDNTSVLYNLEREIEIAASETIVQTYRLRDPNSTGARASLYPGTLKALVADTDYKMSSISGDDGNDLNSSLDIAVLWGGNSVEVTYTNNDASTGYINKLVLTGRGVYNDAPLEYISEDATSITKYGERTITFDMPYQDDDDVVTTVADLILARYKEPYTQLKKVTFIGNTDATLAAYARDIAVNQYVTIAETVTGFSANYFVNAVTMEIRDSVVRVTLTLEPDWTA